MPSGLDEATMKLICIALCLLLSSCDGMPGGYWQKDPSQKYDVATIAVVQNPCAGTYVPPGVALHGCSNRNIQRIEILATLSDADKVCAMAHEFKHSLGYNHDPKWLFGRLDCGT